MAKAEQQIGERQLHLPRQNNAIDTLHQVLALAADQPEALNKLQRIADLYEAMAREQLSNGNESDSEQFIQQGLSVIANHNGLLAAQQEIKERQREQTLRENTARVARQNRIDNLLITARTLICSQRL